MSYGTLQPLTVPPVAGQGPVAPGMTGAPKTADGLPVLGAKGVNTNLFSEKMSSDGDRLNRLENAVQEIRNDFDAMAPAVVRLVAIEADIQNLITQLEVLTGKAPAVESAPVANVPEYQEFPPLSDAPASSEIPMAALPPVAPKQVEDVVAEAQEPAAAPATAQQEPVASPMPTSPAASTPVTPADSKDGVMDVRVGEHPGKTRIVLDITGKASFKTNLDNDEKILLVELSGADWQAATEKKFGDAPLLSSYRVERDGEMVMLIIQLKKTAKVTMSESIEEKAAGTQRIVLDLAAL